MKIGILCVTFNRIDMLKKLLSIYNEQEEFIDTILVINNHSTDGTEEFLNCWSLDDKKSKHIVKHLPENTGGSGGFYEGLKFFMENKEIYDYIYLSDDDAFPDVNFFRKFIDIEKTLNTDVSAVCSSVIDGKEIDLNHRFKFVKSGNRFIPENIKIELYQNPFQVQCYSFVGVFIRFSLVQRGILPDKDLFIFWDDTNHAIEVNKYGYILCFPELKVYHKINNDDQKDLISWKDFYMLRNRLFTIKYNFGVVPFLFELEYTIYSLFKEIIKDIILNKRFSYKIYKLKITAISNSISNKKGKHKIYKPGWTI